MQVAKELTLAAMDKLVFEAKDSLSEYNQNIADEVAKFYSKMCDTIKENNRARTSSERFD